MKLPHPILARIFHQKERQNLFNPFIIQLLTMNIREVLPVTDCTQESFEFPAVKRRKVEATFSGGEISSDGGVVLLRKRTVTWGYWKLPAGYCTTHGIPARWCTPS